jgi:iron complex transport system substrate-binding protein
MRPFWTRVSLYLIAALIAFSLSCTQNTPTPEATATPVPTEITDDLGRSVSISTTPQRIVSLAPSITEILFALGLGDKVVGVDDFSDYPEEATTIDSVGSPFPGFNLESLVGLQPDLVLSLPGEHVAQLEAQEITVVVLQPESLDHLISNIEKVGAITDAEDEAKAVAKDMRDRIVAVTSKTKGAERPKVFYEIDATDPTKPWTVGPGSFVDSLITLAGGENIGTSGASAYFQINTEEIINANPDIIVLPDAQFGITVESVAARPGWDSISAVKNNALFPIDDPNLTDRPGPRIVEGLELLAKIIHPELFE